MGLKHEIMAEIRHCLIIIMLIASSACTTIQADKERVFQPVCRHNAVYAAVVAGDFYPVRIARGPAYDYGEWHAQAQALIKGKWQPLCVDGNGVYPCKSHYWFEPMFYNSLADYFDRQFMEKQNESQKILY